MSTRRCEAGRLATWGFELLIAKGVNQAQARAVADHLIWSELVGRNNFGFKRLPIFLERLRHDAIRANAQPRFVSPELLEGDRAFGHYAAKLAMLRAIATARQRGIAAVAVRNSNFFGAGAFYAKLACDAGMLGLAVSNSFPKVAAHGGHLPVLGTNPFAFGAPRWNGEHLLVDMATSGLAGSTVREHIEKQTPLPVGLAVDAHGQPITDPAKVEEGALLPFGGAKGYALALMVEVLAGVISGAGIAAGVGSMYKDFERAADNGHFLVAIDVTRWMGLEAYFSRIEALVAMVKSSSPEGGVFYPGEVRWATLRDNQVHGVPLDDDLVDMIEQLSAESHIPPLPMKAA
jgi:LDH2 family malate/lactate/ureidoglycolate dehydrogenase